MVSLARIAGPETAACTWGPLLCSCALCHVLAAVHCAVCCAAALMTKLVLNRFLWVHHAAQASSSCWQQQCMQEDSCAQLIRGAMCYSWHCTVIVMAKHGSMAAWQRGSVGDENV